MGTSGLELINIEGVIVTVLVVGLGLLLLLRYLERTRPGLHMRLPIATGFGLRVLAVGAIAATGLGSTLQGGDELTFLGQAHQLASQAWTSGQWSPMAHQSFLHVIVFAAQIKLLGSTVGALRITQIAISLAGVILLVTAVYDLAGRKAARIAGWLLVLEPASVFFNGALLKEPNMELASGLFVFGAVKAWRKVGLASLLLMLLASAVALATRVYVGWFFFAACGAVSLHAATRQMRGTPKAWLVAAAVLVATAAALPAVNRLTSSQSLRDNLQGSQNANSTATSGNGIANGNNLALEPVDFSTRSAVLSNLPLRIRDLLLRPYPWQTGDINQALGAVGSIIALAILLLAAGSLTRWVRGVDPLIYLFCALTVAYALSVGNAGTGFRYRTHLITLAIALMATSRWGDVAWQARRESLAPQIVTVSAGG